MASLGSWALPRRTPTSDSRNHQQQQQQQAMSFGQNQQQEPSRQLHGQQLNRSIYSVVEPSGDRRASLTPYNGVLIDPGLQEANTAVHGQSSHPIENDSSRGQTQGSTPLLAHLSSLGNAQQAHPDQAGSRRLSQQAVHDNSRQSQMPTSLGAQDVVIQNMVMANAQGNSTDNTRQNPTLGTVSTNTQRAPPTAQQHYSHFPQPQQRAQQFQVSQTSWEGDMASRRTSNEAQHLNADRRTGLKYTPSSGGTDGAYSTSNSDGRLRNSHSSGQPTGQPLSNTSPISVVASMSHLNHSGSQAGPVSGSIPRDNTNPQWQLSHMNIRLDQLAKTQAEMLAYLHVELTRRKEWEEQLLKELRQRREQASATRTSHNEHAGPVGPQDVRWNNMARNSFAGNPMELIGNPPFPASHNLPIAGGQGNYTAWSHPQNAPQVSTSGNPSVFNPLVPPNQSRPTIESTNPFPASASQQPHSQSLSAMTLSVNGINGYSHEAEQKQEQSRGAVATLPNFSEVTQSKPSQAELNQVGLTSLPSLPLYVESDNTATAPAAAEEAERTKRKRKADGETGTERPSKKLEVDERGVVIMMSGNTKLKEKPTKIQSVVRKTLYGSMGIPDVADAKDMPIYEEGMQPPDGSGEWKFGNLRFDWNATLRRSSHNVAMRDIVLKHIVSLRAEYDEIPDSEFEPVRLEPAFDQAFGTWKGKFAGKRPGGIRRGLPSDKNSPKPKQNGQGEAVDHAEEGATVGTLE